MKNIINFSFKSENYVDDLKKKLRVETENDELINYQSFMLINPITDNKYPEEDEIFFDRMFFTLRHILYCYEAGWITSERQVFYTSQECLTTIQFIFRKDIIEINCFQRSSNLLTLKSDVEFLNYFIAENFPNKSFNLNIFVSMPHLFKNKRNKVDKGE